MGYDHITGFMHFDLHMHRLQKSAKTLGFVFDRGAAIQALTTYARGLKGPQKVRAELSKSGQIEISHLGLNLIPIQKFWPITLSKHPVHSQDPLLAHKTSRRQFTEGEYQRLTKNTDRKEVLFFNEKDQLCEGSFTNVFIVKNGKMFTPPVRCGLLPGILRQVLLANGEATTKILMIQDLIEADEIYIGNSARGLIRAQLVSRDRI